MVLPSRAEVVFNKTKFVKYVTDLKRWYDDGLVKIKSPNTGEDYVAAFAAGHCQMTLTSVGDHGNIGRSADPGMHWDVALLPVYAGTTRQNSFVGGASLWVLKGHTPDEYKAAAAFLNFIAQPEQALFWSTVTGYIPVTKTGFEYMKAHGFYDKAPYKGREVAIESLTIGTLPTPEPVQLNEVEQLASALVAKGVIAAGDLPEGSLKQQLDKAAKVAAAIANPVTGTRGIRLGGFLQIRGEVGNGLQAIFANKASVQAALDDTVARGNAILRRFEQTYKGKELP